VAVQTKGSAWRLDGWLRDAIEPDLHLIEPRLQPKRLPDAVQVDFDTPVSPGNFAGYSNGYCFGVSSSASCELIVPRARH
jgi:hypothetical protein